MDKWTQNTDKIDIGVQHFTKLNDYTPILGSRSNTIFQIFPQEGVIGETKSRKGGVGGYPLTLLGLT